MPEFVQIAAMLILTVMGVGPLIGSTLLIMKDQTEYRAAPITQFMFSEIIGLVIWFSKAIERGTFRGWGWNPEDLVLCLTLLTGTLTCAVLSAIWVRWGGKALKAEAEAVSGKLWILFYE